jgi:hypothetical protein
MFSVSFAVSKFSASSSVTKRRNSYAFTLSVPHAQDDSGHQLHCHRNLQFHLNRHKKTRIIAKSHYMWWQFYIRCVHMHCGQAGFVVLRVPNIMYKHSCILSYWKSQISSIREVLDSHCRAAEHQILWYATPCGLVKLPTFLNFETLITSPVQTV